MKHGAYRSVIIRPENCGADLEEALDALGFLSRIGQQKPFVDERLMWFIVYHANATLINKINRASCEQCAINQN